jgi:hypothetical protein
MPVPTFLSTISLRSSYADSTVSHIREDGTSGHMVLTSGSDTVEVDDKLTVKGDLTVTNGNHIWADRIYMSDRLTMNNGQYIIFENLAGTPVGQISYVGLEINNITDMDGDTVTIDSNTTITGTLTVGSTDIVSELSGKQGTLIAGTDIEILPDGTINFTGSGAGASTYTFNSPLIETNNDVTIDLSAYQPLIDSSTNMNLNTLVIGSGLVTGLDSGDIWVQNEVICGSVNSSGNVSCSNINCSTLTPSGITMNTGIANMNNVGTKTFSMWENNFSGENFICQYDNFSGGILPNAFLFKSWTYTDINFFDMIILNNNSNGGLRTIDMEDSVHMKSALTVDSVLKYAPDTDGYAAEFCRVKIGGIFLDEACFSHYDHNTTTGYALKQDANGQTSINSASGQPLKFCIGNSTKLEVKTGGGIVLNNSEVDSDIVNAVGTGDNYFDKCIEFNRDGYRAYYMGLLGDNSTNNNKLAWGFNGGGEPDPNIVMSLDNSGRLVVTENVNIDCIFGKCRVGSFGHSDVAAFGHRNFSGTSQYGIIHNNNGDLELNCNSGRRIRFRQNNNMKAEMMTDGTFDFYTYTSFFAGHNNHSDDRIKNNEVMIENALNTIMKLKPQTYDKSIINEEEGLNITIKESGLIAQDIYYDTPELKHIVKLPTGVTDGDILPRPEETDIQQDPDYNSLGWGDGKKFASVNYTGLIPWLIQGMKEQQAMITDLQTRLLILEGN